MIRNKNKIIRWLNYHKIENYTINDDLSVDVKGDVKISHCKLTTIPIQFGIVSGSFLCAHNFLQSLKGCPREVGRSFNCGYNELTSLEFGPQMIGEHFSCVCNKLINLEFSPKKIPGDFNCDSNKLTTLKGSPHHISKNFNCSHNNLISVEFGPISVGGHCFYNNNPIESIIGLPESVGNPLYFSHDKVKIPLLKDLYEVNSQSLIISLSEINAIILHEELNKSMPISTTRNKVKI